MNRYLVMTGVAVLAGGIVLTSSPAGARTLAGGGSGKAGPAALSTAGDGIVSMSCASVGNCSAGGGYTDSSRHFQVFVVSEVNGTWSPAIEVPGTAALNTSGAAGLNSVSCASAGNCSTGGYYTDGSGRTEAFVASQVNGTWGNAVEVPGLAQLNQGNFADLNWVACGSPGNCSAGGSYLDGSNVQQAFVVSEVNGAWGNAEQVPGLASKGANNNAGVNSVSCTSAGNCTAAGIYGVGRDNQQAFVASQVNGVWGKAIAVPGLATLNQGDQADATRVSCASAGNCSAAGWYTSVSHQETFVVSQVNGVWGKAKELAGISTSTPTSVSCASAGNCSVAGYYAPSPGQDQGFAASQVNGTWGKAKEVAGPLGLSAVLAAASCSSAGNCGVAGWFTDGSGHQQTLVASQVKGVWGKTKEVPGTAALNKGGDAQSVSVSCTSAGNCTVGGQYLDGSGNTQAFVASQVNGVWAKAKEIPAPSSALHQGNDA